MLEAINTITSVVALGFSIAATIYAIRIGKEQKRLTVLQIKAEETSQLDEKKAKLSISLTGGSPQGKLIIRNLGKASATNIRLKIVEGQIDIAKSDHEGIVRLDKISPSQEVEISSYLYLANNSQISMSVYWEDQFSDTNKDTVTLKP
ncbi:hypothetical protein [Emcibacter sp.]|uniref:hypothetical protein n=1 Tax=Emcibacter sp. TaxID=1979954 RepID=UPI003A8DF028